MTRVARVLALVAVPLLLLTSCGATGPDSAARPDAGHRSGQALDVHVDVDTPQLRALKRAAAVEPCPAGDTTNGSSAMPDVTLPCLGGGPAVHLRTVRGPAVVNLWAQWCGPCRAELPYYQQLHERAAGTVTVLGIDYQDTQPEAALELVRETGVTYPLLADPAAELRVPFKVRGLPGVVLLDQEGGTHVVYTVIRSYAQLRDLVEEYLGVTV